MHITLSNMGSTSAKSSNKFNKTWKKNKGRQYRSSTGDKNGTIVVKFVKHIAITAPESPTKLRCKAENGTIGLVLVLNI